jgi:heptosyltransferase-2
MDLHHVRKVVIRFPNWLGDCIMASPLIGALHDSFPDWKISLAIRPQFVSLFANDPRLEEVIALDDKGGRFRLFRYFPIAEQVSKRGFELALILPESFSSAFIFYLAGLPLTLGYRGDLRSFMLSKTIPHPENVIHRTKKYLNFVNVLGGKLDKQYHPRIYSSEDHKNQAERLTRGIEHYVVINPFSRAPSRRWGKQKYAELASRIKAELDLNIVFSGAPDEAGVIDEVGRMAGVDYLNIAGKSDLMTSYEIMKKARVYVGNDSGGAHLAASSGTYTLSISGADDPDETRPLAKHGKVVRGDLPCMPCVKNICPRKDVPNECMQVVDVEQVFSAVREASDE